MYHQFQEAMLSSGLEPPPVIIADGTLQRFTPPGDRKNSDSAWYVLFDDGFQAGAFGCWRRGIKTQWSLKNTTEFSPEEKREYARKMAEAKRQRAAVAEKLEAECRAWCAAAWEKYPDATDKHPYLVRKQVGPHGLKLLGDSLMVPVKSTDGTIHGIQFISPDGTKKFKTGTAKEGNCFRIGNVRDNLLIVAEGFATAASIHQATGECVLVAFDAGNLMPVVETIRAKRPKIRILLAADNDAWAKERKKTATDEELIIYHKTPCTIDGKRQVNTGVTKASEVVRKTGAILCVPFFQDCSTHPTDFNDLHVLEGLPEVKRQINEALNPPTYCPFEPAEEPAPLEDPEAGPPPTPEDPDLLQNPLAKDIVPFLCLGYDDGQYYYLPRGEHQVRALRAEQHNKGQLLPLADLQWWEISYPGGKGGASWDAAANALLRWQQKRGIYDPSRVRGRGAWDDEGRTVIHSGSHLIVGGANVKIQEFPTKFIYELAPATEVDCLSVALDKHKANELIKLCDMLSWEKEIFGRLLVGWCIVAPICGALSWRPHIWLTGGSGSGKTSILDNIIRPTVGNCALIVQGNTTEAGIRQALKADARPVIHDEAEAEDQAAQQNLQKKLELARQASSETSPSIIKGTQGGRAMSFRVRSCFLFSSIGVNVSQQADISRITVLTLGKPVSGEQYEAIKRRWTELLTPKYCQALRARGISLLPTIRANATTFGAAIAEFKNSQRIGDQLGSLLAGAYSCTSDTEISLDGAREWIRARSWDSVAKSEDTADELRCLQAILEAKIRTHGRASTYDLPVGELIQIAVYEGEMKSHEHIGREMAEAELKRHGIRVDEISRSFAVSNNHNEIKKMLRGTPWSNNWASMITRLEGSNKIPTMRFGASSSRAVMLPLSYVVG